LQYQASKGAAPGVGQMKVHLDVKAFPEKSNNIYQTEWSFALPVTPEDEFFRTNAIFLTAIRQ